MKKENLIKKSLLALFLFSLIFTNLVLVLSQTENTASNTFFERWLNRTLTQVDAKILLLIMMFSITFVLMYSLTEKLALSFIISLPFSFIIVTYVTPESILGIFRSYETLPLTIATFFPMFFLFGMTFLSAVKGGRTLIVMQWFLWLIYAIFNSIKIVAGVLFVTGWVPQRFAHNITSIINLPNSPEEASWFFIALIIAALISWTMVIGAGKFMNWLVLKTSGLENAAARKKVQGAMDAIRNLSMFQGGIAKGGP